MKDFEKIYYLDNKSFKELNDKKDIERVNNIRRLLKEVEAEIIQEGGFIQIDTGYGKVIPKNVSSELREKISKLLYK